MFAGKRQEEIAAEVTARGSVKVADLAKRYGVTEDLIRKDLTRLEKNGLLKKVYGGAVSVRENVHRYGYRERSSLFLEEREKIAADAIKLMRAGTVVFLDTSATSVLIAEKLRESGMALTVVTDMIAVMEALLEAKQIKLIFTGGVINETRDACWSASALRAVMTYRYDLALLGTAGVNLADGWLYTYIEEDGLLKKAVLERAEKTAVLCEAHKLLEEGDYIYAQLQDADLILLGRTPLKEETEAAKQYRTEIR